VTPGRLARRGGCAATASLTGIAMRDRPGRSGLGPTTVLASCQSSERAFQASVVELRGQLEVLHDHLSPETLVKVERALATIDLAIAEGREALLRDPSNAALSELMASNYRQKIELLRRVTQHLLLMMPLSLRLALLLTAASSLAANGRVGPAESRRASRGDA
jgi:hypothetical protein